MTDEGVQQTPAGGVASAVPVSRRSRPDGRATRYLSEAEASELSLGDLRRRAHQAGAEWLSRLRPWDLYATLTYDPKRWIGGDSPPSYWASSSHLARWVRDAEGLLAVPLTVVAGYELTFLEWPHWHALLATGGVDPVQFAGLSALWYDAHGYARFARVAANGALPVARYVSKYLLKDGLEASILGSGSRADGAVQAVFRFPPGPSGPPARPS